MSKFEPSPDVRPASREDRCRRTHDLLAAAYACADAAERRALLDTIVLLNRGVAEAVASRYRNRGVADDDLEQTAFEGLVKAVHRFDPSVRPDLLTYAVPMIRGEVKRHFRDQAWTIRPTRELQELQQRMSRSVEHLSGALGREPSADELAEDLGCDRRTVDRAAAAYGAFRPASLDRVVGADGTTLGELVAEENRDAYAAEARLLLAPALRHLTERERRILHSRFVEDRSLTEIGEDLGIGQQRVSRLLSRTLRRLRESVDPRTRLG